MPNNVKYLNEIHGSWFDKHNPVIMMDGGLKKENAKTLNEWMHKSDFALAVGTSMVGMTCDSVVD